MVQFCLDASFLGSLTYAISISLNIECGQDMYRLILHRYILRVNSRTVIQMEQISLHLIPYYIANFLVVQMKFIVFIFYRHITTPLCGNCCYANMLQILSVFLYDIAIPVSAVLDNSLLRSIIYMDNPKSLAITSRPFKIVHQ